MGMVIIASIISNRSTKSKRISEKKKEPKRAKHVSISAAVKDT